MTLTVTPAAEAPAFPVAPVPLSGTVGTAYSYSFAATGYPAPTVAVSGGSLPSGLSLNTATGVLSGTPTAAGASSFEVTRPTPPVRPAPACSRYWWTRPRLRPG